MSGLPTYNHLHEKLRSPLPGANERDHRQLGWSSSVVTVVPRKWWKRSKKFHPSQPSCRRPMLFRSGRRGGGMNGISNLGCRVFVGQTEKD